MDHQDLIAPEIIPIMKPVMLAGAAAGVAWLTDVKDIASALTVVFACITALATAVYAVARTYRYLRKKPSA